MGSIVLKPTKKFQRHPIKTEDLKNSMILAMEMCKHDKLLRCEMKGYENFQKMLFGYRDGH